MDKLIIKGGKRLKGTVKVSGSKNASLPVLAATILGCTPSVIHNVPDLVDVRTMCSILGKLGVRVKRDKKNTLYIDPRKIKKYVAPYDLVRMMRASVCVLGPLLGRFGRAEVSLPGGCVIGPRPIDLHLKGLKALGAKIEIKHGYIIAQAKKLRGREIFLGGRFGSSVLATANVMMAATSAKGVTVIENAAIEPEVSALANFLIKMGACIEGAGTHRVKIYGGKELRGAEYSIIPDRIEAGTLMIAGAITKGDITIEGASLNHLHAVIDKLKEIGVQVEANACSVRICASKRLQATEVVTLPYPGFPTDMQAQFMALLTLVPGLSIITEKIYQKRFMHVPELTRMAADVSLEGATAVIKGVKKLSGAPVMASDLRASAALVLAGLAAEGETQMDRIYHLDRGYESLEEKLRLLGADIKRIRRKN